MPTAGRLGPRARAAMQAADEAAAGSRPDSDLGARIRGALAEVPQATFAIVFGRCPERPSPGTAAVDEGVDPCES